MGFGGGTLGFVGVGAALIHEEPKLIPDGGEVPRLRGTLRPEVHAIPTLGLSALHFGIVKFGPQVRQGRAEAARGRLGGACLLAFPKTLC